MPARLFLLIAVTALSAAAGVVAPALAQDRATLPDTSSTAPQRPRLTVTRTSDGVRVVGDAESTLRPALEALVLTLASGSASLSPDGIRIRGIARDSDAWQQAVERARNRVPDGISLVTEVFVIEADKPRVLLCRELFVASTRQPIRFQQAGDRLRTSSHAALDRLVEFAADCPEAAITITGHSDSVGDPVFNLDLSLRRARSVASYLNARGIALERLEVVGAGAAEPVADNATNFGRRQNRRIEFSLAMPGSP